MSTCKNLRSILDPLFERRIPMNRTKMLKKTAALTVASTMLFSTSSSVLAASYQEAEKAALTQAVKGFSSYWDTVLSQQERALAGSKANMTLTLEDGGKALISAVSGGMDFSWLNSLSMDMAVSMAEGKEMMNAEVLLNDSSLCSMNMYMDMAELIEYMQIPELSEAWLKIPLLASMEMSEEAMADSFESEEEAQAYQQYMEEYEASLQNLYKVLGDMTSVYPDTETLTTLMERYGNLVIDNLSEATSTEEALSVEGVSEDCTVYETSIKESNLTDIMNGVLKTAKEDQELKGLLEKWDEIGNTDLYDQLQKGADDLLAELEGEDYSEENSEMFLYRVWVNADGKIKGREISIADDVEPYPIFTWKSPSADGNSALLAELDLGTESITLTGSGQTTDNLLNGEYVLAINDIKTIAVQAQNVTVNKENPWKGVFEGTYNLSFLQDTASEEQNPLAAFGLTLYVLSDMDNYESQIDLTVTGSGAALVTLSVTSGFAEASVEAPDAAALESAIDISNEEAGAAYTANLDVNTILNNAVAAGMPEELVTAIVQSMMASGEDTASEEGNTEEMLPETETADAAA